MKITDVKISYLEIPFPEPGLRTAVKPEIVEKTYGFALAKISTDEGITGIGGQGFTFPGWCEYMEKSFKPFLLNELVEPFYIEIFARYLRSQPFGTTISPRPCCLEMALWDLVGKKAGLPVRKLLGAYQDKVRAYASVYEPYPLLRSKEWVNFAVSLSEEGFVAIKFHIGWLWPDPKKVLDVVKAIRDALGNEIDIMIDAMQAWEPKPLYNFRTALKYAKGLEDYDVLWLEEPLPYFNNPELSAKLCEAVDIQIAGGGAMFGLHTYKTILEKGALDIVQPDVQYAGGILEVKRVASLAEAYGKLCIPHFWGPGIALAATLQVIGSTNIPYVEYQYHPPIWSIDVRDCMLEEPIKMNKDGYVKIPDRPGLGVELNDDNVEKYTVR